MTNATDITVITICFHENNGIQHAYSPELPALHVCGKRRDSVFADIPEVIKMLYKLNEGVDVIVKPAANARFKKVNLSRPGPVRFLAATEARVAA